MRSFKTKPVTAHRGKDSFLKTTYSQTLIAEKSPENRLLELMNVVLVATL